MLNKTIVLYGSGAERHTVRLTTRRPNKGSKRLNLKAFDLHLFDENLSNVKNWWLGILGGPLQISFAFANGQSTG